MVTQGAETMIQTGSGHLIDVIPYVMCLWCIVLNMGCKQMTPAPPYMLWRDRVTRKVSYLVLYNILQCTSTSAVHALILWAGPPLMVRPISCLVDIGGHTPIDYRSCTLLPRHAFQFDLAINKERNLISNLRHNMPVLLDSPECVALRANMEGNRLNSRFQHTHKDKSIKAHGR